MTLATDIARLKLHGAQDGQAFADALAEYRKAIQAEKREQGREWVERCLAESIEGDQ